MRGKVERDRSSKGRGGNGKKRRNGGLRPLPSRPKARNQKGRVGEKMRRLIAERGGEKGFPDLERQLPGGPHLLERPPQGGSLSRELPRGLAASRPGSLPRSARGAHWQQRRGRGAITAFGRQESVSSEVVLNSLGSGEERGKQGVEKGRKKSECL